MVRGFRAKNIPAPSPKYLAWMGWVLCGFTAAQPFCNNTFGPRNGLAGQAYRARKLALVHQAIDCAAAQASDFFDLGTAVVFFCHLGILLHIVNNAGKIGREVVA